MEDFEVLLIWGGIVCAVTTAACFAVMMMFFAAGFGLRMAGFGV